MFQRGNVADDKDFGVRVQVQCRRDRNPPAPRQFHPQPFGDGRTLHPSRPNNHRGRQRAAVGERDHILLNRRHRCLETYLDAHTLEALQGVGAQRGRKSGEQRATRLDQHHPRLGNVEHRIVVNKHMVDKFDKSPGKLHTSGTTANDHQGHQALADGGVLFADRILEVREDGIPQQRGVLDIFQPKGVLGKIVVAEKVVGAARSNDQVIVGQRDGVGRHQFGVKVNVDDLGHHEADIAVFADNRPHGEGHRLGFETGGSDLIKQRPEAVVVVAVND